jgi:hypothetical protein
MNEIKEVPFTANGNEITVPQVTIPQKEVQLFYFRAHDADDAVTHWWQYQNKLWKPTDYKKLDFSSISSGRWIDPTLDLHRGWYWTQDPQTGDDWTKSGGAFAIPGGKPQPWVLDVFTAVGADPTKPLFARHSFRVKPEWLEDGGFTRLGAEGLPTWGTKCQLFLNGQPLPGSSDVTKLLKPGENVVAVRLDPNSGCKYLGIQGSLYLSHARPPAKVVDLSGQWMNDINGTAAPVTFPGKASAFAPTRLIDIPRDWQDKYVVCFYVEGDGGSTSGVIVNETGAIGRRTGGPKGEFDLTPYLKFGEKNTLSILSTDGDQLDPSHDWNLSKVELHLYPKSEYRN